jgi:hypothetical protein
MPCLCEGYGGGVVGMRGDAEDDVSTFIYITPFMTIQKAGPVVCQFSQNP